MNWIGMRKARPFGFYIPYRYSVDVPILDDSHIVEWLKQQLDDCLPEYMNYVEKAFSFNERWKDFDRENPENRQQPRFNQDWFPGLDGAMAYTLVSHFKPAKIIEVGSGHSTRFLAQAIRDGGLKTELYSIDPQPRADIDTICTKIIRSSVTERSVDELCNLDEGDFLFVDCSHIAMPGTDVDYLFTQVFPRLKSGVIIHVHDIFLPHAYPGSWRWRGYNEQNFLLAILSGGNRYEVLCPNAYLRRYHSEKLKGLAFRVPEDAKEASIWMRVKQ
jgi:predicted O-methyltransferase YrrM